MIIKLLVEGGEMKPGPTLAQKLGPMGINPNLVITKVNDATKNFKGLKVPVELDIDVGTKAIEVKVFSPPVSELMKRELGLDKGSGLQKKSYAGNASIEQIISVAKTKFPNMLCKDMKAAVKSVVGTCVSLGILVENKSAADLEDDINRGVYDKEIKSEKTETSVEKKKVLKTFFDEVKSKQEQKIKQEQAAEEAKKAEQAATAAATPAATTTATPATATTGVAKTTTTPAVAKPATPATKKK